LSACLDLFFFVGVHFQWRNIRLPRSGRHKHSPSAVKAVGELAIAVAFPIAIAFPVAVAFVRRRRTLDRIRKVSAATRRPSLSLDSYASHAPVLFPGRSRLISLF
jgi:hypothetical protein